MNIDITIGEKIFSMPPGTPLEGLMGQSEKNNPIVGGIQWGVIYSLSQEMYLSGEVFPVYLQSNLGRRMYHRTLCFVLELAIGRAWPQVGTVIGHSLGDGYFYSFSTDPPKDIHYFAKTITETIRSIIREGLKIVHETLPYQEAIKKLKTINKAETTKILEYRNDALVPMYRCEDYLDISFEPIFSNTALLSGFQILPYDSGFLLRYPLKEDFSRIEPFQDNPAIYEVFKEHKNWGRVMNLSYVGDMNRLCERGHIKEFISIAESFQEKKIYAIADTIYEKRDSLKAILVAGPSSSGKTTLLKRLSLALRVLGFDPLGISLDNYYKERSLISPDETGAPDLESIHSLDLALLDEHLHRIIRGESIVIPSFNFALGRPEFLRDPVRMTPQTIFIIEGIHGLNPELFTALSRKECFKIFISALTQLNLDSHHRISTTDNRLLRRLVRDYQYRNASPMETFGMWESVRRGEKKFIFPWQNDADVAFNSALDYELGVLKIYAEPLLKQIKPEHSYYPMVTRLLNFLDNFHPISGHLVPRNSLLREFIGGLRIV